MNYIVNQLNRKINFLRSQDKNNELKIHYQAKFEYYLFFILGYLFNKNIDELDENLREDILTSILKPSIGTIIDLIRKLDIKRDFFGNKGTKKIAEAINKYPKFRNEIIGHGYQFEDGINKFNDEISNLLDVIEKSDISLIQDDFDIVYVEKKENSIYSGIAYKPNNDYVAWQCPVEVCNLQKDCLYAHFINGNCYYKISPFIRIEDESSLYVFGSIEERLTGRTKYNRLLSTGNKTVDVEEFQSLVVSYDEEKIKHANGTIVNAYTKNYKTYINVGLDTKIISFLKQNTSSVYATLWGHGGVGKTATVQHVIETLCSDPYKTFDYIVFFSAKDRYYNYYKGEIEPISERISSLSQIICYLNRVVFGQESYEKENILSYEGKIFISIDDYETFSEIEKKSILDFINEMNINHHKVVITTRSAFLITGVEIQSSELDKNCTIDFLKQILKNEYPTFSLFSLEDNLKDPNVVNKIHQITSGRPLFILQFASLMVQAGGILEVLDMNIKSSISAKNFLYDRIIEYLSANARNMFLGIGLLADEKDLTGLISNLKYILNMEEKEDLFVGALQELVKLKIITTEGKFFKIYSNEIYDLMSDYYQNKPFDYDGNITSRYNSIADHKELDTDIALLDVADASRIMKNEIEIENKYRYILNRKQSSNETKIKAIFNYSSFLSNNGQIEKAVKLYEDYYHLFGSNYEYTYNYAQTLWSNSLEDDKYKSISILSDYLEKNKNIEDEKYLILYSKSLIYSTILVTEKKDGLKDLRAWDSITDEQYNAENKAIRIKMKQIFKSYATPLYFKIKDLNLMQLSSQCRNIVLTGLNHYLELAFRLNKLQFARQVCEKIIREIPENFRKPYILKLKTIGNFEKKSWGEQNNSIETVLGIKLKEALEKKQ